MGLSNLSRGTPVLLEPRRWLPAAALLGAIGFAAAPGVAEVYDATTYDVATSAGESGSVEISLTAPRLPGLLDIVLVLDQSGSYRNDLPALRQQLPVLVAALSSESDLAFGLVGFNSDPSAFTVHLDLTSEVSAVSSAVAGLDAGGGDVELWLDALDRVLVETRFRPGTQAVVLLATDEESGVIDGQTAEEIARRYSDAGVRVVALVPSAISLVQAEVVVAQTGGTVETVAADSSDIEVAILRGLEDLPVDLVPSVDPGCPITADRFNPSTIEQAQPGTEFRIQLDYTVDMTAPDERVTCVVSAGEASTSFELRISPSS